MLIEQRNVLQAKVDSTRPKREHAEHLARLIAGYATTIAAACATVGSSNRPEDNLAAANGLIGNIKAALTELDGLVPEIKAAWEA
ncbi:hypothetical protein [Bosea sp. MMO-172]|uniref:hypothetical protein n=1 Tax=Bosea sp. MMO-172 TaxID=3127885 RepID=UPI0030183E43